MTQQPDFAEPSPWTRPWFIAAAVFVAAAVLAGIVIAVWPDSGQEQGQAGPPTPAATAGQPDTSAVPTAIPAQPPADVRWELVGQSAVPVSPTAGPRDTATGAGYAHTPDGALVAARQLGVRAGHAAGRDSWEPTITRQFVPGTDRDTLLATLRAAPEPASEPGDLSPLTGYRFRSYTPDTAVIELVYRSTRSSSYFAVGNTLVWQDGDWRMQAPAGGSWLSATQQLIDLTGVIEWGAR